MSTNPYGEVNWKRLADLNKAKLKELLTQAGLDGLLAVTMDNWRYITAVPVPRSIAYYSAHLAFLIPREDEPVLLPMESRADMIRKYAPWYKDVRPMPFRGTREALQPLGAGEWVRILAGVIDDYGLSRGKIALDPGTPFCIKDALSARLPRAQFSDAGDILRKARVTKNEEEIKAIGQACVIGEMGMSKGLAMIREGVREREIAGAIESVFRTQGAEGPINTPFVAAGDHEFLGYIYSSDRVVRNGDLVRIDTGCSYGGYYSDFSRTLYVGSPDDELTRVYRAVYEGLKGAEDAVRPGIKNTDLHKLINETIKSQTKGKYSIGWFVGHGLGVGVHEDPMIGPAGEVEEMTLEPGMYFCLEPSVRVPGKGLIGLEDDLIVTENGSEVLTRTAFRLAK
jgi:Xaa-Pro aminopeptidase